MRVYGVGQRDLVKKTNRKPPKKSSPVKKKNIEITKKILRFSKHLTVIMVLPQQRVRVVFTVVKEMNDEKKRRRKKSHCGSAPANGQKNGVCEKPRENLCVTTGDTFYNIIL